MYYWAGKVGKSKQGSIYVFKSFGDFGLGPKSTEKILRGFMP